MLIHACILLFLLHTNLMLRKFFSLTKGPGEELRQGVTKRCRLSWLNSIALVYEPKCGGRGGVAGSQPKSTAVYTGAQINFGDLTPYLTMSLGLFTVIPPLCPYPSQPALTNLSAVKFFKDDLHIVYLFYSFSVSGELTPGDET